MFNKNKRILLSILLALVLESCGLQYYNQDPSEATTLKWSLVFSTLNTSTCSSALTVSTYDSNGNLANVRVDTTVTLGNVAGNNLATPGSGTFYADANCSVPITSIVIANGNNTTPQFYFKDGIVETQPFKFTATAPGYIPVPATTPVTLIQSYLYVVMGQIASSSNGNVNTLESYTAGVSNGFLTAMSSNPVRPFDLTQTFQVTPGQGGAIVSNAQTRKSFWYMRATLFGSLTNAGIYGFALNNYPVSSGSNTTPFFTPISTNPSGAGTSNGNGTTNTTGKIAADPTGKFLYVAGSGDSNIYVYPIDPNTGALGTPTSYSIGAGLSPRAITFSKSGNLCFVLLLNSNTAPATWYIESFSVTNGVLGAAPISTSPALGTVNFLTNVFIQAQDKFLYSITQSSVVLVPYDSVTGTFSSSASFPTTSVTLKDLTVSTFPTGQQNWLYVVEQSTLGGADAIVRYNINSSTGQLTSPTTFQPKNGASTTSGQLINAQWLTMGSNSYIYAIYNAGQTSAAIGAYPVDSSTGAITTTATNLPVPVMLHNSDPLLMNDNGTPIFGAVGGGANGIMVSAVPY